MLAPVHAQIAAFARRQPGCKTLARELYGVGPLVAAIVWAFLGDTRRFSSSAQAVRHTVVDVTVYSSDAKRTPGHLSHQGPPILRWALFEAGREQQPGHVLPRSLWKRATSCRRFRTPVCLTTSRPRPQNSPRPDDRKRVRSVAGL